jgi:hypothetical protein
VTQQKLSKMTVDEGCEFKVITTNILIHWDQPHGLVVSVSDY